MARKKAYIESEVIDKAMHLFWRNGYECTSMQQLEAEMGINKFSIYASFGSKTGVFLESIKAYKRKLSEITVKLEQSNNGVEGVKQYFYDFLEFSKDKSKFVRGCLITNTANELNEDSDPTIKKQLTDFTSHIRTLFENNVRQMNSLSEVEIQEKADYLIISMYGLASASRVFTKSQLDIYIENIFK
ncbi:TetR/AcrR family transcriptional regulator [Tenacibaculum agarivorans]|uniref:TetR/AcrR family transcriptional regulator n=1 Tax=Tenacibaculum agarivorans TaxID=1908389 RepID=UPI00094BA016|nr:TetR/AcrR family transcriptional regulator [Tenacibaculum agarivorans]